MESIASQLPDYRINEYLIVLNPHEELAHRIAQLRKEFCQRYKTTAVQAPPNITLVRFSTWDGSEERIIQRLQSISMGIAPFKVELKDYGSFPTHTLFINVTTKLPVQRLVSSLKEVQRLMKLDNEHKPHFIDEPHVVIARKLRPWQYEQGWLEYSHQQFSGRFVAEGMLLLKRPAGAQSHFQVANRFEFVNLPVVAKQGNLFA